MPLFGIDVARYVFVGTLTFFSSSAEGSWKAGRAANCFAADGVVKMVTPRPLLKDVDVYIHNMSSMLYNLGVQTGAKDQGV